MKSKIKSKIFICQFFKNKINKNGLSAIIAMLLLVALTLVLVGVVWGVVNSLVEGKIKESEACSLMFGEITINSKLTCYDGSNLQFSISRGDIEVDKLIVAIAGEEDSKTIYLSDDFNGDLMSYLGGDTKIPLKKAGKTYLMEWTLGGVPKSIKVAPVIDGFICDVADSLVGIDNC